ncbi:hypothetical protein MY3957_009325 [Beauveria namnaoensis]
MATCCTFDFGVSALGMNTDTQHLAYVALPGPDVARRRRRRRRRAAELPRRPVQDMTREHMRPGRTGNEISVRHSPPDEARGPRGQDLLPRDWRLGATLPVQLIWSVELRADHFVPRIQRHVLAFPLEEDVYWTPKGGFEWVHGRQEQFHLIRTSGLYV